MIRRLRKKYRKQRQHVRTSKNGVKFPVNKGVIYTAPKKGYIRVTKYVSKTFKNPVFFEGSKPKPIFVCATPKTTAERYVVLSELKVDPSLSKEQKEGIKRAILDMPFPEKPASLTRDQESEYLHDMHQTRGGVRRPPAPEALKFLEKPVELPSQSVIRGGVTTVVGPDYKFGDPDTITPLMPYGEHISLIDDKGKRGETKNIKWIGARTIFGNINPDKAKVDLSAMSRGLIEQAWNQTIKLYKNQKRGDEKIKEAIQDKESALKEFSRIQSHME